MANDPVEVLVFDFLTAKVGAVAEDSPVYEAELHDTVFREIKKSFGIRVGEAQSELAPGRTGELEEFNARLIVVCFAQVEGKDKKLRQDAMKKVFAMSKVVTQWFIDDPSLGNKVCGVNVEEGSRGYDTENGKPFAVALIPIVINPVTS